VSRSTLAAWIPALVFAAYFGLDAFMLPLHLELWIAALWVLAPLLGGLIGSRLIGNGPATVTVEETEAPPAAQ
jgi:hypothetical protein